MGPLVPQGEQGPQGPLTGGTIYTRWGRTTCPIDQGTELVYSGRAGGSHYNEHGGAADLLCLPDDPEYSIYGSGVVTLHLEELNIMQHQDNH